jgi:hypothetical protein
MCNSYFVQFVKGKREINLRLKGLRGVSSRISTSLSSLPAFSIGSPDAGSDGGSRSSAVMAVRWSWGDNRRLMHSDLCTDGKGSELDSGVVLSFERHRIMIVM